MTRSGKTLLAFAAGFAAAALPAMASAQDTPDVPESNQEVRTGTRLPTITVIGAISDPRATRRADESRSSQPELPVVYEDEPAPKR